MSKKKSMNMGTLALIIGGGILAFALFGGGRVEVPVLGSSGSGGFFTPFGSGGTVDTSGIPIASSSGVSQETRRARTFAEAIAVQNTAELSTQEVSDIIRLSNQAGFAPFSHVGGGTAFSPVGPVGSIPISGGSSSSLIRRNVGTNFTPANFTPVSGGAVTNQSPHLNVFLPNILRGRR